MRASPAPMMLLLGAVAVAAPGCASLLGLEDPGPASTDDASAQVSDAARDAPDAPLDADVIDATVIDAFDPQLPDAGLPDSDRVTLCGQLRDLGDSRHIQVPAPNGTRCNPTQPTPGPCSIRVSAYDALAYFDGGGTATPLPHDELYVLDTGQFCIMNAAFPQFNVVIVVLDDFGAADDFIATGEIRAVQRGHIHDLRGFITARATDLAWTQSAGLTGASFAERGVIFHLFTRVGVPVAGVQITENGAPQATHDYYLGDTQADRRTVVDANAPRTGVNGSGITLGGGNLIQYSGVGGEVGTCRWEEHLVGWLANTVVVNEIVMIEPSDATVCD